MPFKKLKMKSLEPVEMLERSRGFKKLMRSRRSVREFSSDPVDLEVIINAVKTAATAPSGANKQPWSFCLVVDPEIKAGIRAAAEAEEKEFYTHRAPRSWLDDLNQFGTDWHKPFLTDAPVLIVVFKQSYDIEKKDRRKNYYVNESVGISCGFLLAALHNAGLAALTHTPSPMGFLGEILNRPKNEKAFLLIPVGLPAQGAEVPILSKKDFEKISTII
ncbi:MAG: nitroreductase family protein [Candidatus Neomarinimicrobiota bacterium]